MIDPEDGKRTCYCGSKDNVRLFAEGDRCPPHTPSALRGLPEPGQDRYCPPALCYCGACPGKRRTVAPITTNVIDIEAIRTGKRRSTPAEYRAAQRARTEHTA